MTPVVGIALLAGLVALGAVLVFVFASGAISGVTTTTDTEQAIDSMRAASQDLESRGYARVELPSEGSSDLDPDAGWMRIEVGNETVLSQSDGTLGTLYYQNDQGTVAYQGGGVWRKGERGNSTVVSLPPLEYVQGDEPTLMLPVITLDEASENVGKDRLATTETSTRFPSNNVSNPVTENVTVTVHSEFYTAWGSVFEQRLGGNVSYDHDAEEATVTLRGDGSAVGGASGTGGGGNGSTAIGGLFVEDSGDLSVGQQAVLDSYNSSDSPYTNGLAGERGDVHVDGDFNPSNGVEIYGDVNATGRGEISNSIDVTGDVALGTAPTATSISNSPSLGGHLSVEGDAAMASGSVAEDLIVGGELQAAGGTFNGDVHVHGQDSTVGDGAVEADVAGDVYAGDDVEFTSAEVQGDVYVDGDVQTGPSTTIHGNVTATGTATAYPGTVSGSVNSGASSVPAPRDPIQPHVPVPDPDVDVDQVGAEFQSDNDNADADDIVQSGGDWEFDGCGAPGYSGGCELTAGTYYLDSITLQEEPNWPNPAQPERLVLNTTDGPVRIYVDGDVEITDPARVEVVYDDGDEHAATIYGNGEFSVNQGAEIQIDDDRTPAFEVFLQPQERFRIEGGSTFRGSLYGLSDGTNRTRVDISGLNQTTFYGAILGDVGTFDHDAEFHYDVDQLNGRLSERTDDDSGDDGEPEEVDVVYFHVDQRDVKAG